MKPVLVDLFTSKKFLAALAAIVIYVGGRFGLAIDPATLDHIFAALLVYVGAQGVADVGKSAAAINAVASTAESTAPGVGVPAAAQDAMKRVAATVSMVAVLVLSGAALTACSSSAGQRASAGVKAFLDCESPHVDAALLADAKGLATSAVSKWLSGSGTIDAAGLKADAAPLKTDLLRCAFDAAIAAIVTPPPRQPGAPVAAAPLVVDANQVGGAWAKVRGELGWPRGAP